MTDTTTCKECGALVAATREQDHEEFHATIEALIDLAHRKD
ncbi:hypothetical protein [Nocardioides bruguierae]|nr:hypothetical protein [Nocardioides bruguierae]